MTVNKLQRRKRRKKQLRINRQIKKRLFKDKIIYPCCYCKRIYLIDQLTVEHIIPLSFGGNNQDSNISLACAPCNHERGRQAWFDKKNQNRQLYNSLKEYDYLQ